MRIQLYGLTMFLGAVALAVHLAMNGAVGAAINNARVGNAFFWLVGAVMAALIGLSGWQAGALGGLRAVNPILLTAGAIGACLVFGIGWLIPQIGASSVMFGLLAGQILGGMVLIAFRMAWFPCSAYCPTQHRRRDRDGRRRRAGDETIAVRRIGERRGRPLLDLQRRD